MGTTHTSARRVLWLAGMIAMYLAAIPRGQAQILDEIEVRDGGALAEIRIGFTLPMQ